MKSYFHSTKYIIIVAIILFGGLPSTIFCQFLYKLENPSFSLKKRIDISLNQTLKYSQFKRVWIAYMIKNKSAIPMITMKSTNSQQLPGLNDFITDEKNELNNGSSFPRSRSLNTEKDYSGTHAVTQDEYAIMIDYNVEYGMPILSQIIVTPFYSSFDLQGRDVYWLGEISIEESIKWLQNLFDISQYLKIKRQAISTLGYHMPRPIIDDFFKQIIWGDYNDQLKEDCIFLLGVSNSQNSEKYLSEIVLKMKHIHLQKKALLALSQSNSDFAFKIISMLACKNQDDNLRKEAIFCLGQMDNSKILPLLQKIIISEKALTLKEFTVFVISQVSNKKARVLLQQISKQHPDAGVRKKALFWLEKTVNHNNHGNFNNDSGDF